MALDLAGKRVLIFVVAYNAETTIQSVLRRIPAELHHPGVEVLVIDDSSKDETFARGVAYEKGSADFRIRILRTPENQGYGGNQKLGYHYAINHGFDVVALLHGDGQYPPEKLPMLLEPVLREEADAVLGSRMLEKGDALKGGMPLYKWFGNQVLTRFQNFMLSTRLSEFHSGYRVYATKALQKLPFERNSNDFHFDTEIIIQLVMKKLRILELAIPTYYGDEICYVNGMQYAWDVFRTMLRAQAHSRNLLFDRKFDVAAVEHTYDLKLGFESSHTFAIASVQPGARVLDIGCGQGLVAKEIAMTAGSVVAIDQYIPENSSVRNVEFRQWDLENKHLPVDVSQFDQIFLLDIVEHLKDPEDFMDLMREATARKRPEVVMTTANIGFFVTRLMLILGHFNYGRKGILDRTHTRLFTFSSLRELFEQTGYKLIEIKGIPAPYPKSIGDNWLSRLLLSLNMLLLRLSTGLFAYQIFVRAQAKPTVSHLLEETIETSATLRTQTLTGSSAAA